MAVVYFKEVIDRGGVNKFAHLRKVRSVETQNIIRENRDTLYSWGIFDVKEGLEISLPQAGDLYMSVLVIDNDTYIVREEDYEQTRDILTSETARTTEPVSAGKPSQPRIGRDSSWPQSRAAELRSGTCTACTGLTPMYCVRMRQ